MQEPPAERSAEQLLKSAEVHFQDGCLEEALKEEEVTIQHAKTGRVSYETEMQEFLLDSYSRLRYTKMVPHTVVEQRLTPYTVIGAKGLCHTP